MMIEFPCRCKYAFQVPADQAGLSVQCPKCGLLMSVPNVGDTGHIEPDGTYTLEAAVEPFPEGLLKDLSLVYYPKRQLSDGTEIDLRGPVEGIATADEAAKDRPKYDPETGELLGELGLQQTVSPPPNQVLPQATRVIDYNQSSQALEGAPRELGVFQGLFLPTNLFVMGTIFVAHIILAGMMMVATFISLFGIVIFNFFGMIALFALVMLIAGHYAITLEEIGRGEKDDLPRVLRNVQLYEDYLVPAWRILLTLALCYWPAIVILRMNYSAAMAGLALPFPLPAWWLLGVFLVGSALLPAVFLTICTSGSLHNLRPDRVVGLITKMGFYYPIFVLGWVVAASMYLLGVLALPLSFFPFAPMTGVPSWVVAVLAFLLKPYVSFPLLAAGIYLTFAFCWQLGLHYRLHWREYPWVLQYYEQRTVTLRPTRLHPKMAAADANAAKRANSRQQVR